MSERSKPTVVFLNHWAKRPGGAEHSLADILSVASHRFHCVLVTSEEGWLTDRARDCGVRVVVVEGGAAIERIGREGLAISLFVNMAGVFSFGIHVARLYRLMKKIRPDLIHANVPKSHVALMLLHRMGTPGIPVLHIREIFTPRSFALRIYQTLFVPGTQVIAISRAVKDGLPARMRRRCMAIRNGIVLPPEPVHVDHPSRQRLRLLYMGRVVAWKGCHYLLDVIDALCLRHPDWDIHLSIVGGSFYGGDRYRARLEKRIAGMSCSSHISLSDHTDTPLPVYLSNDVFVNASWQEPFGRVLAEAAACALPVVSFDSGGVGEIVEHGVNGFLVPYGDVDALTDAIDLFIADPSLVATMGLRGREKAERDFNASIQIPRIVEHLVDCIME